ncbi:MAG: hypothetical protein V4671_14315, partial [Armatimonadota bacterium]
MTNDITSRENNEEKRPSATRRIGGWIALTVIALVALTGGFLWSNLNKIGGVGGASSVIGSFRDPKGQFPGK